MVTNNNILVVGNDMELCDALGKYLDRYGYNVKEAETSQMALSVISDNKPSIVIADSQLKDKDGVKFLETVREKFPEIQVIMIIDEKDVNTGVECLRMGASDYLTKPINGGALEVALQRACHRREVRFQLEDYQTQLEAANKNRALFQQLFDEVPCYISIQDRNFRLTGANKQFKQDFGDFVGSYCYEIYKHRTEPCRGCPVEATFKDGKPQQTEEVVTSQHGNQYNVLTWTAPLRDDSGNITQVMEMSTNITKVRKLQSRLTTLGLLLGSMSHSIRGVLTALDGGIYRLESGLKKGNQEQVNDAIEVVKNMINRISSMVIDILYYTKERSLNWTEVNVMDFSNQIAALIKPKADKHHIEFIYKFEHPKALFEIDPGTVSSALVNILENSIDACLYDRDKDKSHRVVFRVYENGNHTVFEARDNGMGMDRETRENLFTLFFSSKGHSGTGLGLYVANQIVEQHGGLIEIESELKKGSCFKVKLPKVLSEEIKKSQSELNNVDEN